ncbi:MAG: M14 family zinc carboxypeptidase [Actinomycetota bacterium]
MRRLRIPTVLATALVLVASAAVLSAPAGAQLAPPWDGNPISPGLGPTYDEAWCAPATGENVPQTAPLAIIPYAAIGCTLDQFQAEAAAAGVPPRMEYSVIGQSVLGRDIYGVVVNAMDTPEQQRDYQRWLQLREIMTTDPLQAQLLLRSWGQNVKLPVFIEANIHGGEREGTDAIMQVIRDMTTLPYGTNAAVDDLLDHVILVVIPTTNPDGRVAGRRQNENFFDMNRDLLVQSQPEIRANTAFQQEWLAPVGLFMHGYFNPTLVDGLTKPHNPGMEYDKFLYWNQRRLDANEVAIEAIGRTIQRPVNDWNMDADDTPPPPTGPPFAEGWDDWGPFYTQTYGAFFGVDGSTTEMCSNAACGGRLGSKREQYILFYSSAVFWLQNRQQILDDQLEIFRRGVTDAGRPSCCDDPLIASRDFTDEQHNWMVEYPTAYVIPFVGGPAGQISPDRGVQRSDAEANRLVEWLFHNGILVERTNKDISWGGQTFPKKSYVVWMDQALRGIALTALSAGQDISERITQLYAPPGAWSHGELWGADVVEIPRGDGSFNPKTIPVGEVNPLQGGVRGGGPADWYAVAVKGAAEVRAVLDLLRGGTDGEVAEAAFNSASAGPMPAGSLIFPNDAATVAALEAAGVAGGFYFERGRGAKPATTQLDEAPRVAILVNSANPTENDTSWSLRQIFGPDVSFVSVVNGTNSLQNAATDPLESFDVIYNTGQNFPSVANATARARLIAFFERGGGYIGTGQAGNNFTFLNTAVPPLLVGTLVWSTDSAGGGIARWTNEGTAGPLTGGFPATDNLYLPSSVTWFSSLPTGAAVDGRYFASVEDMFVAGLWRDRDVTAANSPVIVHGTTTVDSRYLGFASNPFSRGDAEREWPLIGQAALWSNLTDE